MLNKYFIPVFLLTSTTVRFNNTAIILKNVGFKDIRRMPAVFVTNNKTCCGNNGHRLAFRRIWRKLVAENKNACIFEDDIALTNQKFRPEQIMFRSQKNLIFLGEFWKRKRWWTNHAACLTPHTANILLQNTNKCIREYGISIDTTIKYLCNTNKIDCVPANKLYVVKNNFTWWGDFYQNRSIPSHLHDINNNMIYHKNNCGA